MPLLFFVLLTSEDIILKELKEEGTHNTTTSLALERYLERKKNQSEDDQYGEAGALISEMETINTDKAYSALRNKMDNSSNIHSLWAQFSRVAAILIIPLLVYTLWSQFSGGFSNTQLSYQEISSPSGVRSKVTLPDGSKVWLNAESKIQYSIPFVRETRELKLEGEAFLDVTKNPESPLIVTFSNLKVQVLGTKFNIKTFPDDKQTEVVLKEGSILLENRGEGASKEQIIMKPDERWVFDRESRSASLKEVDADQYIAWHKNRLVLNQTSMEELAKILERWYGIKVKIDDRELYKYKFTTIFDNEPLFRVTELLEMSSPIHFNYIPGTYNKDTGETEKSILEISRK